MTEGSITRRLAAHFDAMKNVVLPNYSSGTCGWEADLLVVRPSGWAEEIEVKISQADFRAEFRDKARKHRILVEGHPKYLSRPWQNREFEPEIHAQWDEAVAADATEKTGYEGWSGKREILSIHDWRHCTPHQCKKYWFAMPLELAEKLLPEIPVHAGLIAIYPCQFNNGKVQVLKEAPVLKMAKKFERVDHVLKCAYYRMWDLERGHRKPSNTEVPLAS